MNTGLEFEPGETIRIRASAQVHLAQNRIWEEELPLYGWISPEGEDFKLSTADGTRGHYLILRHDDPKTGHPKVGNLIGAFHPIGIELPVTGHIHPHPKSVFHVGAQHEAINQTGLKATLWLCVNDIVLNDSEAAQLAYLGNEESQLKNNVKEAKAENPLLANSFLEKHARERWAKQKENWEAIKAARRWDIFFLDNIGTYLVKIEKE